MPHCRVVSPGIERLHLSDGDWIDVKRELNAGEYSDLLNDMVARKPFSKILQYLIVWSFVGLDGKPLPYTLDLPEDARRDTIRSLNKATLRELIAKIDKHEAEEEARLDSKKNTPAVAPASPAISPSVAT
jgi:hypothetical protein